MMYYSFVIDDLIADNVYVVSMNVSVCLESGGACEVFTKVFEDHRLPKQECDYNSHFVINGMHILVFSKKVTVYNN